MDEATRQQLLALCREFYVAHADAFDASRGHRPWPGWRRLLPLLPRRDQPLRVLDVGCGNARLASFLEQAGFALDYVGVDANASLLEAARLRLGHERAIRYRLLEQDFLSTERPGDALPTGPFDLVALFGVLHHVPGRDWRLQLLETATERLGPGGRLVFTAWRFQGLSRFERRRVDWSTVGHVEGRPLDPSALEAGDALLRFGDDPSLPPRYCHHLSPEEIETLVDTLDLEPLASFAADGGDPELNQYEVLGRD